MLSQQAFEAQIQLEVHETQRRLQGCGRSMPLPRDRSRFYGTAGELEKELAAILRQEVMLSNHPTETSANYCLIDGSESSWVDLVLLPAAFGIRSTADMLESDIKGLFVALKSCTVSPGGREIYHGTAKYPGMVLLTANMSLYDGNRAGAGFIRAWSHAEASGQDTAYDFYVNESYPGGSLHLVPTLHTARLMNAEETIQFLVELDRAKRSRSSRASVSLNKTIASSKRVRFALDQLSLLPVSTAVGRGRQTLTPWTSMSSPLPLKGRAAFLHKILAGDVIEAEDNVDANPGEDPPAADVSPHANGDEGVSRRTEMEMALQFALGEQFRELGWKLVDMPYGAQVQSDFMLRSTGDGGASVSTSHQLKLPDHVNPPRICLFRPRLVGNGSSNVTRSSTYDEDVAVDFVTVACLELDPRKSGALLFAGIYLIPFSWVLAHHADLTPASSTSPSRLVVRTGTIHVQECFLLRFDSPGEFKRRYGWICEAFSVEHRPSATPVPRFVRHLDRVHDGLGRLFTHPSLELPVLGYDLSKLHTWHWAHLPSYLRKAVQQRFFDYGCRQKRSDEAVEDQAAGPVEL